MPKLSRCPYEVRVIYLECAENKARACSWCEGRNEFKSAKIHKLLTGPENMLFFLFSRMWIQPFIVTSLGIFHTLPYFVTEQASTRSSVGLLS